MPSPELYLIDGSAIPTAPTTPSGRCPPRAGCRPAVFGFQHPAAPAAEPQPEYLAVAFDAQGPVFRHRLYDRYKANRPPMPEDLAVQIPYIRESVAAHRILVLEHDDQEADDLIASVTARMTGQGCRVVVVSGDKDLLQLVSADVTLWDPMNDRVMDEAAVAEKYGLPPGQLLDYFALTGDSSDNIPGVPGIGPKSAQKLIGAYHTLENLYQAAPEMKPGKAVRQLLDHREQAFLSRDLVRLNHSAEVPAEIERYRVQEPDIDRLRTLYAELEFHSLLKEDLPAPRIDTSRFHLVGDAAGLARLAKRLEGTDLVAVDTETDSLDTLSAHLVGVSLCVGDGEAWYLPCGHRDAQGALQPGQLRLDDLVRTLRPVLTDGRSTKIGHNLKFDLAVLAAPHNGGLELAGPLYDTMVGAWLIDPDRRSYKLDDLCKELGLRMTGFAEVTAGDKAADAFARVGLEAAGDYSCEDVYGALQLYRQQVEQLAATGLDRLLAEVEGPLIPVLAGPWRSAGILVDSDQLARLSIEFGQRLFEEGPGRGRAVQHRPPPARRDPVREAAAVAAAATKTAVQVLVQPGKPCLRTAGLPGAPVPQPGQASNRPCGPPGQPAQPAHRPGIPVTNQCGTATVGSGPATLNIPIRTEEDGASAPPSSPRPHPAGGRLPADRPAVLAHYLRPPPMPSQGHPPAHRGRDFFVSLELSRRCAAAATINFGIIYEMSEVWPVHPAARISRKEADLHRPLASPIFPESRNSWNPLSTGADGRAVTTPRLSLPGRHQQHQPGPPGDGRAHRHQHPHHHPPCCSPPRARLGTAGPHAPADPRRAGVRACRWPNWRPCPGWCARTWRRPWRCACRWWPTCNMVKVLTRNEDRSLARPGTVPEKRKNRPDSSAKAEEGHWIFSGEPPVFDLFPGLGGGDAPLKKA